MIDIKILKNKLILISNLLRDLGLKSWNIEKLKRI